MLRDVFYYGKKPNIHPRERPAKDFADARHQATTEHFWVVNEFCDYTNFDWDFDFDFLPDDQVWHEECINVWPSVHQKDSGTWLCPKEITEHIIYRIDVDPLKRYVDMSNWILLDKIDKKQFDFSWHPDPTEPPYVYKWGCFYYKAEVKHVLEYVVPGAKQDKWMPFAIALEPDYDNLVEVQKVDRTKFDMSWRPDPLDPPYIYIWGNKYIDGKFKSTLEYHTPGATEKKYMEELLPVLPEYDRWVEVIPVNKSKFDFTWRPDPREPPFIYVWGNKYYSGEYGATIEYHTPGATERKYMTNDVEILPVMDNYKVLHDVESFDFAWRPNPTEPPYIYVFGNQYYPGEIDPTVEYHVEGATEVKYISDIVAKVKSDRSKFKILHPIIEDKFDFAWRPNPKDPPYIYVFGNQWHDAIKMPTVTYTVEGAVEHKFITDIIATLAPDKKNWKIPKNIDDTGFDYSWVPDPDSPPYIYEFGTQWQKTGGPKYIVEDGTEKKYMDFMKVKRLPNSQGFEVTEGVVVESFDYSWHPDDTELPYIYVFGNNLYPSEIMPTIRYVVNGATEIKYVNDVVAKLGKNKTNWHIPTNIEDNFDYSWVPNPKDPPYIYQFGTQHQKTGGPKYVVPGATEIKYVDTIKAKINSNANDVRWQASNIKIDYFDYSWHPDDTEPPYIYVFGNEQYSGEIMPTIRFVMEGATEEKFIHNVKAKLAADKTNWKIIIPIDESKFDFSWVPNPKDPPYIYVFGNQWNKAEIEPTLEYHVEGATEIKYVNDMVYVAADKNNFKILMPIVEEEFDFSWRPNPKDPAYIYVFGNQWFNAEKQHTVEYHVLGATEYKYVTDIIATLDQNYENWDIPETIDTETFDFSWVPDPGAPPYIYQFGTLADDNDGPRYITPNNNGEIVRLQRVERKNINLNYRVARYYIETTLEDLIDKHRNEIFWAMNKNINYDSFDFSWRPSIEQARYVHVFGSPESILTQTYFVSAKMYHQGYKDFNFVQDNITLDEGYLSTLFKPSHVFFVDRGNAESNIRYEKLKEYFPNIIKTRYLNSWVDTINRCIKRSTTQLCWILNSELDYTDFDFKYYPNPWQINMVHVFGTQWSHWGTTFMVNKDTFPEDTKYINIIEHLGNLHFVKTKRAKATNNLYDIFLIDHGNSHTEKIKDSLRHKLCGKQLTVIPYNTNYLTTFKDIIDKCIQLKEHYIWITSSVCDYTNFDFSYICDPFAKENLHVFPSDGQKFGDTFLVDVNRMRELLKDMNLLEEYVKINYNQHQRAQRLPAPLFISEQDNHNNVTTQDYDFPYAIFKTHDNSDLDVNYKTPISLWSNDTKNIEILSTGGSVIVVPNEVRDYVKEELYDYPYISRAERLAKSKPLDIVFLSNGEKCADENYEHLLRATKNFPNRVVRVDGVNGRANGYHASAEASNTPWTFTVFAKLKVNNRFDWSWQPDRLQVPKHYIFNALNPVNKLVYGHQSMIAYNKKLVLNNPGRGLDFTLDDPHESIDMLSGTATFNTDPFSTWRTAFREVIKLKSDYKDISYERLQTWLTVSEGQYAQDCLQGAKDGVEYYNNVSGDPDKLKLSYEWDWLKDYYNRKYT